MGETLAIVSKAIKKATTTEIKERKVEKRGMETLNERKSKTGKVIKTRGCNKAKRWKRERENNEKTRK